MKQDEQAHILQCSEVWSGIRSIESTVVSRGLKAWIWSTPYREDAEGAMCIIYPFAAEESSRVLWWLMSVDTEKLLPQFLRN